MKVQAFIVLLCLSSAGQAQTQPQAAASQPAAESVLLQHRGSSGIWFPMPSAKRLLEAAKTLPQVKRVLATTEARLAVEMTRSELLAKQVGTSGEIAALWQQAAKQQAQALAQKDSFWRSPYFWVATGFLLGAGTAIGIAVAVKKSGTVN